MKCQSLKPIVGVRFATVVATLVAVSLTAAAFAQREKVIYDFTTGENLGFPNLISDASGNLYGASYNLDTLFELSPPTQAGGSWTQSVLYTFQGGPNDGAGPLSLAIDKNGIIFGTTLGGGIVSSLTCPSGCGVVFELSPPAQLGGAWTETILYKFPHGLPGPTPPRPTGITVAPGGSLYGAAGLGDSQGDGVIFQLRPPAQSGGAWAFKALYQFKGGSDGISPTGSFVFDKNHNLYGTTRAGGVFNTSCFNGCGTVFELSPPAAAGGSWTKTTLFSFLGPSTDGYLPEPGLIMDKAGNLYGSTLYSFQSGTVFELTPPSQSGGAWSETILHVFTSQPDGALPLSLTADPAGNLYGATCCGGSVNSAGIVYQLTPPAQSGGAWTENILHTFPGGTNTTDGVMPNSNLVYRSGVLYGSTTVGGPTCAPVGCGVIFAVRP